MRNDITFGSFRVVFPSNIALYITSISWVISMNLGVVLVTLIFLHRLVMLPVPMEPLSIPPVLQSCASFHVEYILPKNLHLPYALVRRKSRHELDIPQIYFLCMSAIPHTVTGSCTSCSSEFFQIIHRC